MNAGKTLFAQVMDFAPWKTFGRIVERHRSDAGVRTLSCTELFRMGMRHIPAHSTLADALNLRDWRIYHALAMRSIDRARKLYAQEPRGRIGCHRLRTGFKHHRPVSGPVRLGPVSRHQGRGQDPNKVAVCT